jgi:hypothetical protein
VKRIEDSQIKLTLTVVFAPRALFADGHTHGRSRRWQVSAAPQLAVDRAECVLVRDDVEITDSALSQQVAALGAAAYLSCEICCTPSSSL